MAKSDIYNNPLLPMVLIAGIFSGSVWRPAPPAGSGQAGESAVGGTSAVVAPPPASWMSELRPVMDTIAQALGEDSADLDQSALTSDSGISLDKAGDARDDQIGRAMRDLQSDLLARLHNDDGSFTCRPEDPKVKNAADALGAWFLTSDSGEKVTPRVAAANALIDEYRGWSLLASLATRDSRQGGSRPHFEVDFTVATVPDYVDSNSGWLADQNLAAIQAGMTSSGYLFDRVKLIDWSRNAGLADTVSSSHLHERQPGAMIFRSVKGTVLHLQVVLLVLETPTAGVHETALRNSLRFVHAWDTCSGASNRELRVLGPSFSGSIVSLASVLGEPATMKWFPMRLVISGSANADDNVQQMNDFSNGAIYRATIQPTSVLRKRMAEYLAWMNADWKDGGRVALLKESNTAYGQGEAKSKDPFALAANFSFPLHVAQLRSDAPAFSQPGAALFPNAIIPLNLREPSPPTDLLPALRPQLTSPVVEATVASIFDTIRHEKYTAVGIVATDDRDVLFLARELKRASPDVQLFLFGTHALYLHPDYVPYLRGALVATSYSLSLANQPEIQSRSLQTQRESFQSMSAAGMFYATKTLLLDSDGSPRATPAAGKGYMPYCVEPLTACVPVAPLSVSVIGEDGYWTLPLREPSLLTGVVAAGGLEQAAQAPPLPKPRVHSLPPLPRRVLMGAILVALFVLTHLVVLYLIRRELRAEGKSAGGVVPFLELPFVRVLAPPRTVRQAVKYHRFALTICFLLLASLAAWVASVTAPFWAPGRFRSVLVPLTPVVILLGTVVAAFKLYGPSHSPADANVSRKRRPPSIGQYTGWLLFVGMSVTMLLLWVETVRLIEAGIGASDDSVIVSRMVGGGILSPAVLTVGIVAAIYAAVITSVRRLSLVGRGYAELSRGSSAFALMKNAAPAKKDGRQESLPLPLNEAAAVSESGSDDTFQLAAVLDMPAYNLPTVYPLVVLFVLAIAWVIAWEISTIDGPWFSWFVRIGSLTALGVGLLLVAQGLATWNTARSHLKQLARSRIEPHLEDLAKFVPWEISLAPPRLTELLPVARMADDVKREFRELALTRVSGETARSVRRALDDFSPYREYAEQYMGVRGADMKGLSPLFEPPSHVDDLQKEMSTKWQQVALIQSNSWFELWRLSDAVVLLMEGGYWRRTVRDRAAVNVAAPAVAAVGAGSETTDGEGERLRRLLNPGTPDPVERDGWFARCERLVALQMAFVVRDIVARTITCLFAAMLCLTFLTASHLFYAFNGRASMLTVDLFAVAGVALSAVWILVDMERDQVLSRLRSTSPGRVDLNWDFMRRIAVYGVLPLLVVLAALFPEIGGALFGWLEPLRKLSAL